MSTLADAVAAEIRGGIRSGRYLPDTVYSVYQLSAALGVSRSPVREAMLRLSEVGLVEIARNRGFRVLLPDPRDLAEIFAVRLALEVPAAGRLAAQLRDRPGRAETAGLAGLTELSDCMRTMETTGDDETFWSHDRRLHHLILTLAGNTRAARIVAGLRDATNLLGEPTGRTHAAICREHRPIVEAILRADPEAAQAAMDAHLHSTGMLLMARAAAIQSVPSAASTPAVRSGGVPGDGTEGTVGQESLEVAPAHDPAAPDSLRELWDEVVGGS